MIDEGSVRKPTLAAVALLGLVLAGQAFAADSIKGRVLGAGAPISNSTVTLYAASAGAPRQVAQTQSGADGQFTLTAAGAAGKDDVLYLVAKGGRAAADKSSGDNPAIALVTVVGHETPAKVTINEMTTVASVWTNA